MHAHRGSVTHPPQHLLAEIIHFKYCNNIALFTEIFNSPEINRRALRFKKERKRIKENVCSATQNMHSYIYRILYAFALLFFLVKLVLNCNTMEGERMLTDSKRYFGISHRTEMCQVERYDQRHIPV